VKWSRIQIAVLSLLAAGVVALAVGTPKPNDTAWEWGGTQVHSVVHADDTAWEAISQR
jgi:hypothetical protein